MEKLDSRFSHIFKIIHVLIKHLVFLRFLGTMRGHVQAVYMICWSADSRLLVSGSADSTLKGLYFILINSNTLFK